LDANIDASRASVAVLEAHTAVLHPYSAVSIKEFAVFEDHTLTLEANTTALDDQGSATLEAQYMSRSRLEPNTDASSAVCAILDAQRAVLDAQLAVFEAHDDVEDVLEVKALLACKAISATLLRALHVGAL
jgi:hypothetical protein